MYYTAAIALRTGHASELYSRDFHVRLQRQFLPSLARLDEKTYTHPPFELLVFLPFSFLPYKAACYCWITVTVLLAVLCGRLLANDAAVLALFPLLVIMLEQQDSLLALLILIGCWLTLRRGKEALAGFILGLALFKFQIVIPLGLVLLFWRRKTFPGLALSGVLVTLLSFVMVGPAGMLSYAHYLSGMAQHSATTVSQYYLMDPRTNPTLRGLTYELTSHGSESVAPAAARWLPVALILMNLLCLAFAWKFMRSDAQPEAKFAFAILLALLLSFHLLMHDLILLALPFTLLRRFPARWPLIPFYLAPLVYLFYPHSQAWLALLLVSSCVLLMSPKIFNWRSRALTVAAN
jgi:hypothetical protein